MQQKPPTAGGGHLGGILLQHHASLRAMNQPMVVASPLKVPLSQLPYTVKHHLSMGEGSGGGGGVAAAKHSTTVRVAASETGGEGGGGEGMMGGESAGEGGGKKEYQSVAQPPKRIRLTRKSAGLGSNED